MKALQVGSALWSEDLSRTCSLTVYKGVDATSYRLEASSKPHSQYQQFNNDGSNSLWADSEESLWDCVPHRSAGDFQGGGKGAGDDEGDSMSDGLNESAPVAIVNERWLAAVQSSLFSYVYSSSERDQIRTRLQPIMQHFFLRRLTQCRCLEHSSSESAKQHHDGRSSTIEATSKSGICTGEHAQYWCLKQSQTRKSSKPQRQMQELQDAQMLLSLSAAWTRILRRTSSWCMPRHMIHSFRFRFLLQLCLSLERFNVWQAWPNRRERPPSCWYAYSTPAKPMAQETCRRRLNRRRRQM